MKDTENKNIKWGMAIFLSLFSFFLLYLNFLTPFIPGDDFLYPLKFPDQGFYGQEKITSLGDLLQSTVNHYINYNYRVAPHFILQVLHFFPKGLFNILNVLVFLLIPLSVLRIQFHKDGHLNAPLYFIVLLLIWCFHFDLGRSYFWMSGSLNYSWLLIPQLYFVGQLYLKYYNIRDFSKWDVLLSILICTSNENVVLALFGIASFLLIKKKLDKFLFTATLVLLAGGLIMFFSPSLESRAAREFLLNENWNYKIIEFAKRTMYYTLKSIPLLVIYFIYKKRKGERNTLIFFVGLLCLSVLPMFFAPLFEPRSAVFPFLVFLMFLTQSIDPNRIRSVTVVFLLLALGMLLAFNRSQLFLQSKSKNDFNRLVLEKNANSKSEVLLTNYCFGIQDSDLICDDVSTDYTSFENQSLANYFNIEKVKLSSRIEPELELHALLSDCKISEMREEKTHLSFELMEGVMVDSMFTKEQNNNLAVIIKLLSKNKIEDLSIVVRGSRRGVNKYRLFDLLPVFVRVHFLDFLENEEPFTNCNGAYYSYSHIDIVDRYDYIILMLYAKKRHAVIGEPIILDNKR
ncbi:MAG: hypothetical protein KJN84_09605 [Bacteroidia bacterium]|nr:hypothetical protein [Bacteroidia bacterium]